MNTNEQTPDSNPLEETRNIIAGDHRHFSRRNFCRTLALPAGALALGSAFPAFAAEPSEKPQDESAPPAPARNDATDKEYETKVLWNFDGCLSDRFMQRVHPYVYNGNVYMFILLPGLKTMIAKVPLDGGKVEMFPLMPGHVTGNDPHRYYAIAADSLGHIHVSGDMHSSAYVKHWISKKPEDISGFVFAAGAGSNKGPQGVNVTYPQFFRSPDGVLYHKIRCADPVWGIGISVLNVRTQTWSMLGAEVKGSTRNKNPKVKDKPMSAWEDNGEGGFYDYTQPHAALAWGTDKRMHLAFGLLNENTPSSSGRHTLTHALYAYSDDGGKTIHRNDGSRIKWPIRAEGGPNQGDVVYSEHEGSPRWLDVGISLRVDEKNRPVVSVLSTKTGRHSLVLEKGKWTELRGAGSPASDSTTNEEDEVDTSEKVDVSKLLMPNESNRKMEANHFRETGNLVYTILPKRDRFKRILVVLSKPIKDK